MMKTAWCLKDKSINIFYYIQRMGLGNMLCQNLQYGQMGAVEQKKHTNQLVEIPNVFEVSQKNNQFLSNQNLLFIEFL
ncbi:unnamed protein product [Paramecium octaurelia]|uniref:Uncharacterized protein n=1 Tax=Paramecium octaurelia TaxID=43137 RepID=A0A8S1VZN1_PAROT|nr:unnamed protein product [Paramecium octaurelia]